MRGTLTLPARSEPPLPAGYQPLPALSIQPPPARSIRPPPARSIRPPPAQSIRPPPEQSIRPPPAQSIRPPPAQSIRPPLAQSIRPPPARSIRPPPARSIPPPPAQSIRPPPEQSIRPPPAQSIRRPPPARSNTQPPNNMSNQPPRLRDTSAPPMNRANIPDDRRDLQNARGRGRGTGRGRGNRSNNVNQNDNWRNNDRQRGDHQGNNYSQDEHGNENRSNRKPNQPRRSKYMGFKSLEEISHLESCEALIRISNEKEGMRELLQKPLEPDFHVLLLRILANICSSDLDESKGRVLIEVCNSNFILNLQNYLMNLIYYSDFDKVRNRLYWTDASSFWENLLVICETVTQLSPSTALQRCRALVDGSTAVCLDGLRERHGFSLPPELTERLHSLRESFTQSETIVEEEKVKKRRPGWEVAEVGEEPPENFRELPVLPTLEEINGGMPFVRPNLVDGSYASIEHYLDVQFRLLREDCYGPLREGIQQYKRDPKKKKFDNIRVHREVVILEPYQSKGSVGCVLVQFEKQNDNRKRNKRYINWAHSKRFMFGALLLLSDDQCKNFILATVSNRDIKMLEKGNVPVRIDGNTAQVTTSLFGRSYLMIESEVYFEPYYHVLRALQDPAFARSFPMQQYIVQVQPDTRPPAYLTPNTEYKYKVNNEVAFAETRFRPLLDDTWPSAEQLGLDDSQYSAYKLLLTHEFAVVQGPPGTGKTYLGSLAARTLLNSLSSRMLVICYTNHALDQFLEAILTVTDSIARIGGQSKSEVLAQFNLMNLRKSKMGRFSSGTAKFFFEKRSNMESATREVMTLQKQLDIVNNGMVDYMSIAKYVREIKDLFKFTDSSEDPVRNWLFENAPYEEADAGTEHRDEDEGDEEMEDTGELDEDRHRALILDDEVDLDEIEYDMRNVFDMDKVKHRIWELSEALRMCETHHRYFIREEIRSLRTRLNCFMVQRKRRFDKSTLKITERVSPARFSHNERWDVYYGWMRKMRRVLIQQISALQDKQRSACEEYEEARIAQDLEVLRQKRVIGITTTGAARLQKLMRSLVTPIVIVEEAAEVLECHIVVSLTRHCQHLILIGDHQQLRPSAAHYKLAKHYNLEVSLFERMISNGIHSRRLGVQHRMRPAIASLVAPTIYRDLLNHASVESYPSVRGVTVDLFFLTHQNPEDAVDDSRSRCNKAEADLTLALANYIMQQGYRPEHVTILAAYSGQMFYMRKERNRFQRLKDVKITVVDNYQGEESEIILLSLVRNNAEGVIGFLGDENRVCVALSRARQGFYLLGNMEMLSGKTELWKEISKVLERQQGLGPQLTLRCEVHPDQITQVEKAADFARVPEGGCMLKCDATLRCAHACPLVCHGYDRSHKEVQCPRMCERVICEIGHVCPLPCAVECAPCSVPMLKKLPCGHEQSVACHIDPHDRKLLCRTLVDVALPACGHQAKKQCHVDVKSVPCVVACEARLPCGHACTLHCHKTSDPDHERYTCEKPCAKTREGCTAEAAGWELGPHACPKKCYETCDPCNIEVMKRRAGCGHRELAACSTSVDETPCRKNCKRMLPCGHHCKNKCHEPCGNCSQKVKKVLDGCGHEVTVGCSEEPLADQCAERCNRTLPCGHTCTLPCSVTCRPASCRQLLQQGFRSPCGHTVQIRCSDYNDGKVSEGTLLRRCRAPCDAALLCGHGCGGACGECRQGRLHAPCAQPCDRLLLCGHKCEEPCRAVCPPCRKPCEVRCPHSSCNRRCGELCPPCKERCSRRCPHGECARRCDEPCARAPCVEPCPLPLPCGHRCCGLCGEPCPDACRVCRPDDFPTDLLGDPYPDDAKLIQLQDCARTGASAGHFLELEDMDNLMYGDREAIMIRACPFCRTLILNTQRYKDQINATFRDEIQLIKRRVNGDPGQIRDQCDQLRLRWRDLADFHLAVANGYPCWKVAMRELGKSIGHKQPRLSLLQVNVHAVSLDVLRELAECCKRAPNPGDELRAPFTEQMKLVCGALALDANKISEQQQQDLERELLRTRALTQLGALTATPEYRAAAGAPRVRNAYHAAAALVLSWEVFRAKDTRVALELLQKEIQVSGVITPEERGMIRQAMGLKQGHWFKCPNGHIYCIGECGGAMERASCPECKADIGGTNHTLLPDNELASEMDNASHAAWSDVANNMANWHLE